MWKGKSGDEVSLHFTGEPTIATIAELKRQILMQHDNVPDWFRKSPNILQKFDISRDKLGGCFRETSTLQSLNIIGEDSVCMVWRKPNTRSAPKQLITTTKSPKPDPLSSPVELKLLDEPTFRVHHEMRMGLEFWFVGGHTNILAQNRYQFFSKINYLVKLIIIKIIKNYLN